MSTPPAICRSVESARRMIRDVQQRGGRTGFVPTMGALHAGHLSLVAAARERDEFVAVSIFVNPTQFGPQEDLNRYPRTWDADFAALTEAGAHMIFAPPVEVMYPSYWSTAVEPPRVSATLEGECRPGHFRGVATIVLKLFQIVPADDAFFGEKDYQQCLVIRDMVRDFDLPIEFHACPTVREPDGLAMSSRNRYLDAGQRQRALGLWRGMQAARAQLAAGLRDARQLEQVVVEQLQRAPVDQIEYVAIRDPDTLETLDVVDRPARLLIAARVGATRLIDNCGL